MFRKLLSKRLVFRYLQVGAISAVANFLFFASARTVLDERISDITVLFISTSFAIAFAFYLQSTYVWATGYKDISAAAKFTFLNLAAFALNVAIFRALTDRELHAISAQALSLMCFAAISFFVQKKWIFLT
jgi:hypothetical protein